eukprot:scaffold85655_cov17-Tisochrysis_lutea.AAC.1
MQACSADAQISRLFAGSACSCSLVALATGLEIGTKLACLFLTHNHAQPLHSHAGYRLCAQPLQSLIDAQPAHTTDVNIQLITPLTLCRLCDSCCYPHQRKACTHDRFYKLALRTAAATPHQRKACAHKLAANERISRDGDLRVLGWLLDACLLQLS